MENRPYSLIHFHVGLVERSLFDVLDLIHRLHFDVSTVFSEVTTDISNISGNS